ncbi:MAG: hypothetical protein NTY90_03480 [Candidatus Micrarchaeota archaeon]|nr:hypothetical protein [Candidatus Micrarchaeota archaeon]
MKKNQKQGRGKKKALLEPLPKRLQLARWLKLAAIIVGVALASVIATVAVYCWAYDVQVLKYDMHLYVEAHPGFNIATDAIWFGKVPPTATSTRKVLLKNSNPDNRIAQIYLLGDLAAWTSVSEQKIPFGPNQSTSVDVVASVPFDAPFGYRGGWMLIVFKRP